MTHPRVCEKTRSYKYHGPTLKIRIVLVHGLDIEISVGIAPREADDTTALLSIGRRVLLSPRVYTPSTASATGALSEEQSAQQTSHRLRKLVGTRSSSTLQVRQQSVHPLAPGGVIDPGVTLVCPLRRTLER